MKREEYGPHFRKRVKTFKSQKEGTRAGGNLLEISPCRLYGKTWGHGQEKSDGPGLAQAAAKLRK